MALFLLAGFLVLFLFRTFNKHIVLSATVSSHFHGAVNYLTRIGYIKVDDEMLLIGYVYIL